MLDLISGSMRDPLSTFVAADFHVLLEIGLILTMARASLTYSDVNSSWWAEQMKGSNPTPNKTSDGQEKKFYGLVIRLPADKNIIHTQINQEVKILILCLPWFSIVGTLRSFFFLYNMMQIRDTSMLIKVRLDWEELRSTLTANVVKCFEFCVYTKYMKATWFGSTYNRSQGAKRLYNLRSTKRQEIPDYCFWWWKLSSENHNDCWWPCWSVRWQG